MLKISVSWDFFCFYKVRWSRESKSPLRKKWKCHTWITNTWFTQGPRVTKDVKIPDSPVYQCILKQGDMCWSFVWNSDPNFWKSSRYRTKNPKAAILSWRCSSIYAGDTTPDITPALCPQHAQLWCCLEFDLDNYISQV